MAYKLLHAHGEAGPNKRRSYLAFGTYSTKKTAEKASKRYNLDSKRIVPTSKVGRTRHPKLFYIKK